MIFLSIFICFYLFFFRRQRRNFLYRTHVKKVILVNGNFSEFVLHLAAGSDKGIKKGAGEVAVCHFGIFGYLQ